MLVGGFQEAVDDLHRLREFLGEFLVFLIAPGVAQACELALQGRELIVHLTAKPLETVRETPQFARIDDGLGHELPLRDGGLKNAAREVRCPEQKVRTQALDVMAGRTESSVAAPSETVNDAAPKEKGGAEVERPTLRHQEFLCAYGYWCSRRKYSFEARSMA